MSGSHMKYMLVGGLGLLGLALALGLQLQTALLVAFVLACPLMMMGMMGMTNSNSAHAGHGGHGTGGDAGRATVTDPVCGMQVDPAAAAAQRDYQGRLYYFCSQHCAERFAAAPPKFAGTAISD
jgi:YHS domain-containing protein